MSMRSVFEAAELKTYPHNAFLSISHPRVSLSKLSEMSLADLALHLRNTIQETRNLGYVKASDKYFSELGNNTTPFRSFSLDSWAFSNQVAARIDNIDFGIIGICLCLKIILGL
jgi:hypothetical protein